MRVAVIGAGPAGLTAAFELARRGARVEVFEAGAVVGGLARSLRLWGQTVDLGPHRFFSSDPRVNRFWLGVVGTRYRMVERRTRILHGGELFDYPLRPGNALLRLGPLEAARCLASYARQVVASPPPPRTFEQWVVGRFGRRLYETFFRSYSEKLWGIPCDRLDSAFAAQRIKRFSLGEAIRDALGLGGERHATLAERFAYPVEGTGWVYGELARRVEELGGRVRLDCPVERVELEQGRVRGLTTRAGESLDFDEVVSSMPLTLLVRGLRGVPEEVGAAAGALRFRNTVLAYLRVRGPALFPDQWLYVHAPELGVGRISNFRNWVPELHGEETDSVLSLEYWCSDYDPLWSLDDAALVALAGRELAATGLARGAEVVDGHVTRIRRCYPVYELGYREHLGRVVEHLAGLRGLTVVGRYGAFKYNNQDHSILMGLLAAENLADGAAHDLWSVNADYTYQEEAFITETGLTPGPAT